jgi:hypothetical protein
MVENPILLQIKDQKFSRKGGGEQTLLPPPLLSDAMCETQFLKCLRVTRKVQSVFTSTQIVSNPGKIIKESFMHQLTYFVPFNST